MLRHVTFDALIVLGCRVRDARLSRASLRRVERAALAYREQGASLVIAAGGKSWNGAVEAEVFARGLVERGVPSERLLLELDSLTTRGNARGVAALLQGRSAKRLGLVTCDWHMRRALRLFRQAGLYATPLPAPSPPRSLPRVLGRFLRERASSLLDRLLAPFGLSR